MNAESPQGVRREAPPVSGKAHCFRSEASAIIEELGPKASKIVPIGTTMHYGAWLNWPDWLREGTSLSSQGALPKYLTVADDLLVLANLLTQVGPERVVAQVLNDVRQPLGSLATLAFANAPNPLQALAVFARLNNVQRDYFHATVEVDENKVSLTLEQRLPHSRLADVIAFITLILAYKLVASFYFAIQVQSELSCVIEDSAVGGSIWSGLMCQTVPRAAANQLTMPESMASIPNDLAEANLWTLALEQIATQEKMREAPEAVEAVRNRVQYMLRMKRRTPRLKEMATIGMSARTIARSLAAHGTSFYEIVEEQRRLRAVELINDPTLSLAQVAKALGYTDMSSFGRSFLRWFGTPPGKFRNSAKGLSLTSGGGARTSDQNSAATP